MTPRQVVDNSQKRWGRSQLYEWSEGPRDQICIYRPYAAKPKQKDGGDMVSLSGHAFISSGHQHQPVGSACARENRSTRPTHPFTTPKSGHNDNND
ncbi:hypothetical protein Zm00014a_027935 [Zea mays]|jgi:Na+-transporting NADH:ubiquinone oxidoreductase subunit NqrF|uniref:Uncharacterized protein n=1 Tax=Zea mays TaxID=4577 RepID=A0A3L6EI36_MAIZE|nr:hypothetical protein Zm00014a_027935 [Zea mays]